MSSKRDLDDFTGAYVEAALWSSTDESSESGGDPLDKNYGPEDIAPPTMRAMQRDCATFVERYGNLVEDDDPKSRGGHDRWGMAGHDFWLSRNGHGAGFFDGDWPKHGDELQTAAESYGSFELYVGDDGVVYGAGAEEDSPGAMNEHRDARTGQFAPGPGGQKSFIAVEFDLAQGQRTGKQMVFTANDLKEAADKLVYTLNLSSSGWRVSPSGRTVNRMTGDIGWHIVEAGSPAARNMGVVSEHHASDTPDPSGEWAVVQRMMKVYARAAGLGDYVHNSAVPAGDGAWRFWAQRPGERSKEHRVTMQALKNAYDRGGLSEHRVSAGRHHHAAPRRRTTPSGGHHGHRVADFDNLEALVEHERANGATHVLALGQNTVVYYPTGRYWPTGQPQYEAAKAYENSGYWHVTAQRSPLTGPLHGGAQTIEAFLGRHAEPRTAHESTTVRDYDVVDNRGRRLAGPFKDYGQARSEADRRGGVVGFVAGERRGGCPVHGVAAPRPQCGYRAEASRRQLPRVKWNQQQQGNAHVSDGQEGYWATFPRGTSAQRVLDVYMATADYSGATGTFTVTAEIEGRMASVRVGPGGEVVGERHRGGYRAEAPRRGRPAPGRNRGRRARDYSVLSRHGSKMMEKSIRGRSVKEVDAEAAGERYAEEQLNGDHFKDWVWEQMVEGRRMRKADPKSVIPLENAADFKKLARNMLQQLGWDMDRDLDMRTILETVGVESEGSSQDAEVARDFGKGVRAMLTKPSTIQWLASECRTIERDLKRQEREAGGGRKRKASEPAQTVRLLPPAPRHR